MGKAKPTIAVVGLGLVGGSLARALTRAGYGVIGVDRESVRRRAVRAGAVAGTTGTIEAAAGVDVMVLAAPPEANRRLLRAGEATSLRSRTRCVVMPRRTETATWPP